jgi:rare lipoprotein A
MKKLFVAFLMGSAISISAFQADAEAKTTTGWASYYKTGRVTANGERFNPMGHTAAHRSLPFGTLVRVTNIRTGKSVVVRINDRGPFIKGRIIDLSLGAAQAVGLHRSGVAKVEMVVLK